MKTDYFTFRNKVWKALDDCDDDRLQELKECEPELYNEVMDELKAIQNYTFIRL